MRVELSPELEEMRRTLRRFVDKELQPLALKMDETGEMPARAWEVLRENGFLGMRLAPEDGGQGVGIFPYCLTLEEFNRAHREFTMILEATSGMTPIAIARYGTAEQKEKYLKGLVTGEIRTAFALTEPAAGSDAANIQTRAKKTDGGWIINGRKHYISNAHKAHFIMALVVTDAEKRARGGITAFLIDKGTPGFEVTRVEPAMGTSPLCEIEFNDCFVPDEAVLGAVGSGFKTAMESLTDGRLGVSCSAIGAAGKLLEMAIEHARNRKTFGAPLSERQAIQWMIVDSATELQAARALTYEILRQVEAGQDVGSAASMCKVFASEMCCKVADRVIQIHGGMGLLRNYPVERTFRDSRHYRIGEGTSEVHRMLIARGLLEKGEQLD